MRRLLSGELDPASEEARAALEAAPELRERLRRAQEVVEAIDSGAGAPAGNAAPPAGGAAPPGGGGAAVPETVAPAVEFERVPFAEPPPEWLASEPKRKRPASFYWVSGSAIAAASLLIYLMLASDPAVYDPTRRTDVGPQIEFRGPMGLTSDYGVFAWSGDLAPGGHYEVQVYAQSEDGFGAAIERSPSLQEPLWDPGPEVMASWPDAIRWEVLVYDGEGRLETSAAIEASRTPP